MIAEYGADAFRCYEMFMGPLEQMKPWSMTGVEGVSRFLARVWRLMMEENQAGEWILSAAVAETLSRHRAQQRSSTPRSRKSTEDIEALSFNTAIAQMMIFVNAFTTDGEPGLSPPCALLLVLLNPFAPHHHLGALGDAGKEIPARASRDHQISLGPLTIRNFSSRTKWKSPCK